MFRRRIVVGFLLIPGGALAAQVAAGCTLGGRVESDAHVALARASITAIQGAQVLVASSDSLGHFRLQLGEGSAVLVVRVIGFAMQRRVVQLAAASCEPVVITLGKADVELPAVRISAPRSTPPGSGTVRADDPALSRALNRASLGPEGAANIAAMLGSTPGVGETGDFDSPGFSVLGLSSDQSVTTLNGARVDADEIPGDAGVLARESTSPFDVSHGGFSGGELTLMSAPAGGMPVRHVGLASALVPLTTAALRPNLLPVATTSGVLSGSGLRSLLSYRLSWDATQRSVAGAPWGDVAARLFGVGTISDSLRALAAAARSDGLPSGNAFVPAQRARTGSLMLRADAAEWHGARLHASLLGNWRGSDGDYTAGLTSLSHSTDDVAQLQTVQVGATTTSGGGALNEFTLTAVRRAHTSSANSPLPDIGVQLGSDGRAVDATAWLGGNAALPRLNRAHSVQLRDELSEYVGGERHLLKLTLSGMRSVLEDASNPGSSGAFSYASVSDFIANVPAEYSWSRTPKSSAYQDSFAASLGDDWSVTPSFQLQYGARLDDDALAPGAPQLDAWRVTSVAASPRAGFSWVPGRADPREQAGPHGVIVRGGLGRFHGTLPLATAVRVTASSSITGQTQVVCVGSTIPVLDWTDVVAGALPPHECVGGSVAPSAELTRLRFARGVRPPSAWRAELGGSFPAALRVDVDATYSLGRANRSQVATNLRSTPALVLADEANRPVLVSASQIDPRSGIPEPHAGRADADLPQLFEIRSDMRSRAAQLVIGLSPNMERAVGWAITYTYQRATEQQPTLGLVKGGPGVLGDAVAYDALWSRALNEMRHQVVASAAIRGWRGSRFSLSYVGRSGMPFTPVVAGDIDGDGVAGDAAFVFDPLRVADTSLAKSMRALLTSAPAAARRCLSGQLGRVASRDSCVSGWSGDATAQIEVPADALRAARLAAVSLQVVNLLAGADALFHGLGAARGWGATTAPDPVLLRPVGFDAAAGRYLYSVNSGFGSRMAQTSTILAPFSVSLSVRFVLGRDADEQRLAAALRDVPLDSAAIARRLGRDFGHAGASPLAILLASHDVALSDTTAVAMNELIRHSQSVRDSLWGAVAAAVIAHRRGETEPAGTAQAGAPYSARGRERSAESRDDLSDVAQVRAARDADFREVSASAARGLSLLTPAERLRLPFGIRALLDPASIERQRALAANRGRGG